MKSIEDFIASQRELLKTEQEADNEQLKSKLQNLSSKDAQLAGLSLLNLQIEGTSTGLFGRCTVTFACKNGQPFENKSFKVGDEVVFYSKRAKHNSGTADDDASDDDVVTGIVTKVQSATLVVVCEDEVDESRFDDSIRVDLRTSDHIYSKYVETLVELGSSDHPLVTLLFKQQMPSTAPELLQLAVCHESQKTQRYTSADCVFDDEGLNTSQRQAVRNITTTTPQSCLISLIQGPPGTGKTSTVVEMIRQAVSRGNKVLVCAPSNVAVDNILERLAAVGDACKGRNRGKRGLRMVRLGHPARVNPAVSAYCLDSLIAQHEGTDIVNDVKNDLSNLRKDMNKNRGKRSETRAELRELRREVRQREEKVVKDVLGSADIVLCTCVTAKSRLLRGLKDRDLFDLCIIDEAAQALEICCWIPILRARRVVLVGDHKQLPPTVKSAEASAKGLSVTLFERLVAQRVFVDAGLVFFLDTQYRMNRAIASWASAGSYGGELLSHASCADRTVAAVSSRTYSEADADDVPPVLLLLDTASCEMWEHADDASKQHGKEQHASHRNVGEANVVLQHVRYLLDTAKVPAALIGVITPYTGQLSLIKDLLRSHAEEHGDDRLLAVEAKSVDGFQGGEKECIVMSLVRSNRQGKVGFLSDRRRINVAVTRARVHLAVVCDSETTRSDAFISSLLEHIKSEGEHVSVLDMQDAMASGNPAATAYSSASITLGGAGQQSRSSGGAKAGQTPALRKKESGNAKPAASASASAGARQGGVNRHDEKTPAMATAIAIADPLEEKLKLIIGAYRDGKLAVTPGVIEAEPCEALLAPAVSSSSSSSLPLDATLLVIRSLEEVEVPAADLGPSQISGAATTAAGRTALRFPSSLSARARYLVHEVAAGLQLYHRSAGENEDRYIEVSTAPFAVPSAAGKPQSGTAKQRPQLQPQPQQPQPQQRVQPQQQQQKQESQQQPQQHQPQQQPQQQQLQPHQQSLQQQQQQEGGKEQQQPQPLPQPPKPQQVVTAAVAKAAAGQPARRKPGKAVASAADDDDDDDGMAAVERAIRDNEATAQRNQFRVGLSAAFPSSDHQRNELKLKIAIAEAETRRRAKLTAAQQAVEDAVNGGKKKEGGQKQKKDKKPPVPNPFAGAGVGRRLGNS